MGKQHYFFKVRTVMTKHTTLHYITWVNKHSYPYSHIDR
ncbi:hypothetical protein NC652_004567 [Populus alba x Populus x berolinensis]|uniref:Uncharacterized protein n=1 Tax=Populus alba x Populus x berolinensis TaxID=444605 RepID=A0AAD6RV97_9ROSI|nr:hypothetical protein NC652_004567 [Populus alba x Populus x berolinensis]KAJ7015250.1 hypothetical protein NC653_004530 [Populus alba x Populus x berolinensis]